MMTPVPPVEPSVDPIAAAIETVLDTLAALV